MSAFRFNDPIEPMTLGNMRENGVRSLAVYCHQCHHETIINADQWPPKTEVPSFGPRMVCTKCGTIGADVRPNWREKGPLSRGGVCGGLTHLPITGCGLFVIYTNYEQSPFGEGCFSWQNRISSWSHQLK